MGKRSQQKGLDSPVRMDEQEEVESFWKNPEHVCSLLDLLFLGREDELPTLPPS